MNTPRTKGRPKKAQKYPRYNITFPPDVAALAERAKNEEEGLSGILADCLRKRYAMPGRTTEDRASYNTTDCPAS